MTLVVSAYWHDAISGGTQEFTDWDAGHHWAGAESDLWVAPEDLEAFVAEVQGLLAEVDSLRVELGRGPNCSLPH